MIRKNGSQYCVYSKEGKQLSCYTTRGEAERRLEQVEYFANRDKEKGYKKDKKGGGKKK
jgi:hypothetical protein